MGNFLVRYASRVVIYDRRAVIRLATGYSVSLLRPEIDGCVVNSCLFF